MMLRSSFGAIEDWNQVISPLLLPYIGPVAVVLRGDRGLELFDGCTVPGHCPTKLRSSFGAIEDWNQLVETSV